MDIGRVRQLLQACEQGDVKRLELLLEEGPDIEVDCTDEDGTTALQAAAANGSEEAVEALLLRGAALDKGNTFGWTPLLLACRYGHTRVAQQLIRRQANVNAQTRLGANALTMSVRGGHTNIVQLLLSNGIEHGGSPLVSEESDVSKLTPLHVAALQGYEVLVTSLANRGWDVNQRAPSTELTPLMCAAMNGQAVAAQLLLDRGAEANLEEANGRTALHIAAERRKQEVKELLEPYTLRKLNQEARDTKPDIIEATKKGDLLRIKEILDIDPDMKDYATAEDGYTPLMYASMAGRLDIVQLLVESGCDMDKQEDLSNCTALMQAVSYGKKHVAKYLLHKGADVHIKAKNKLTAWDMATFIDDIDKELCRMLAFMATKPGGGKKPGNEENPPKPSSKWWGHNRNRISGFFKKLNRTTSLSSTNLTSGSGDTLPGHTDSTSNGKNKENSKAKSKKTKSPENSLEKTSIGNTMASYTLMGPPSRSISLMNITPTPLSIMNSDTLKPVIPPFMPATNFDFPEPKPGTGPNMERTVNNKHPMIGLKNPVPRNEASFGMSNNPNRHSSAGIQPATNGFGNNPSPNSSGGASSIGSYLTNQHGGSSATSSTLTPRSDAYTNSRRSTLVDMKSLNPGNRTSLTKLGTSTVSPNSSASGGSASQTSSKKSSTSGKSGSKGSTLTGSTIMSGHDTLSSSDNGLLNGVPSSIPEDSQESEGGGEVARILSELKLESYQSNFEKEMVDMEAFLTLSEDDLQEIGIEQGTSRRQIMSVISELRSGKNLSSQQRNSIHSDGTDLDEWSPSNSQNSNLP